MLLTYNYTLSKFVVLAKLQNVCLVIPIHTLRRNTGVNKTPPTLPQIQTLIM